MILPGVSVLRINLDDNDFRVAEEQIHAVSSCLSVPAPATTALIGGDEGGTEAVLPLAFPRGHIGACEEYRIDTMGFL